MHCGYLIFYVKAFSILCFGFRYKVVIAFLVLLRKYKKANRKLNKDIEKKAGKVEIICKDVVAVT